MPRQIVVLQKNGKSTLSNIFLISDTHFGHANCLNFKRPDGSPLRPFTDVTEMDEAMIKNWNDNVRPGDKIYHLGDVGFRNATYFDSIMSRLNGEKVLIKGNHDQHKLSVYARHFKDVRATHSLDKIILSHVPIHYQSLDRWRGNVHGHLHANMVDGKYAPLYYNVSVEHTNYAPVAFETIRCYYEGVDDFRRIEQARSDAGVCA